MEEVILNDIIEAQMKNLASSEKMKGCLQKRLYFIGTNNSKKSEYEKNEDEIIKMKTYSQIEKLDEVIITRKNDLTESFGRYIEELEFKDKNIE